MYFYKLISFGLLLFVTNGNFGTSCAQDADRTEPIKSSNTESPQLLVVTKPSEAPVTLVKKSPNVDAVTKQHRDFVKQKLLPSKEFCGLQFSDNRAYPGNATALDEYPWLVHITFIPDEDEDPYQFLDRCNGVLINQRYVLTSEYCGTTPQSVRLGQYYTNQSVSCVKNHGFPECTEPWDVVKIEEEIHRTNSSNASLHDFALLRLERNVVYSDFIRPICLPLEEPEQPPEFYTFSGWGSTANVGAAKKRLHYKPTNVSECYDLDVQEHHKADQKDKELYRAPNDLTPFCLIPQDKNGELACTGDEAGPIMRSERLQWFADGVITRVYYETKKADLTDNLCSNELPVGGVKITQNILNWIFDNMRA